MPVVKFEALWPALGKWVDQARVEAHMPVDLETIKARIAARDMQLWGVRIDGRTVGAVVSEIYGTTCALPYVAGESIKEWLHLLSVIEEWARANGCTRIEGNGRSGWERMLKRQGWRVVQVTVAKELE